jgi:hypothetical protein
MRKAVGVGAPVPVLSSALRVSWYSWQSEQPLSAWPLEREGPCGRLWPSWQRWQVPMVGIRRSVAAGAGEGGGVALFTLNGVVGGVAEEGGGEEAVRARGMARWWEFQ